MAAYAPDVAPEHGHIEVGAAISPHPGKRTRRPASPAETARPKAKARELAEIGYEWQRTRLGKEVSQ